MTTKHTFVSEEDMKASQNTEDTLNEENNEVQELPELNEEGMSDDLNSKMDGIIQADEEAVHEYSTLWDAMDKLNGDIQGAVEQTSFLDGIPILSKFVDKKTEFKQSSFRQKMETLFSGYDDRIARLDDALSHMREWRDILMEQYNKYLTSIDGVDPSKLGAVDAIIYSQRVKTIQSLENTVNRINIREKNSVAIAKTMKISRSRYFYEMTNAIYEIGAEKRVKESLKTLKLFEDTATERQTTATQNALEAHKDTTLVGSSVMDTSKLDASANKLLGVVEKMEWMKMLSSGVNLKK